MKNKIVLALFSVTLSFWGFYGCNQDEAYTTVMEKRSVLDKLTNKYGVEYSISDEKLENFVIDKSSLKKCESICQAIASLRTQKIEFVRINDSLYQSVSPITRALSVGADAPTSGTEQRNVKFVEGRITFYATLTRYVVGSSSNKYQYELSCDAGYDPDPSSGNPLGWEGSCVVTSKVIEEYGSQVNVSFVAYYDFFNPKDPSFPNFWGSFAGAFTAYF